MTNSTIIKQETTVFCTLQVEGTHNWPNCPFEEVAYLRDEHRHMFHITAYKPVVHSDRDVEFIMLKHNIREYLSAKYLNLKDTQNLHRFGAMSCEMIANELISEFSLSKCIVSEDNENGAEVTSITMPKHEYRTKRIIQ